MTVLTDAFFDRDASRAQDLLGKVLRVHLSAQVIETGAYYKREKASHAARAWQTDKDYFLSKRQA